MLQSEGLYSNFWCGMTDEYYYMRTDQYKKIYYNDERGTFNVPMIHSAILININDKRSDSLTFNKTILSETFKLNSSQYQRIPTDDIIIFSLSANYSNLPLAIVNEKLYGYILVPLEQDDSLDKDYHQMINVKVSILNDFNFNYLNLPRELNQFVHYPIANTLTLDKIYMINLERRPERRLKMEQSFREIGLLVEHIPAFDGQTITDEFLLEKNINFLPGYTDPYHHRPMTKGEIGCFLSHFYIWEKMIVENLNEILILEDDIRFEPYFMERALLLLNEARSIGGWDLM